MLDTATDPQPAVEGLVVSERGHTLRVRVRVRGLVVSERGHTWPKPAFPDASSSYA